MESQHFKIESDTKSRYEGILAEKLQELRELYDTEAKQYRDETDNLYSSKVQLLLSSPDKRGVSGRKLDKLSYLPRAMIVKS